MRILNVTYFWWECDFFFLLSSLSMIWAGREINTWWWCDLARCVATARFAYSVPSKGMMWNVWQYNVRSRGGVPPRAIKRLMCTRIRRKSCVECVINVSASRDDHRNRLTSSRNRRETRRLGVKIWWCSSWRRFMPRQPRTRNCWTSVSSGPTIGWDHSRRLLSRDSQLTRYKWAPVIKVDFYMSLFTNLENSLIFYDLSRWIQHQVEYNKKLSVRFIKRLTINLKTISPLFFLLQLELSFIELCQ